MPFAVVKARNGDLYRTVDQRDRQTFFKQAVVNVRIKNITVDESFRQVEASGLIEAFQFLVEFLIVVTCGFCEFCEREFSFPYADLLFADFPDGAFFDCRQIHASFDQRGKEFLVKNGVFVPFSECLNLSGLVGAVALHAQQGEDERIMNVINQNGIGGFVFKRVCLLVKIIGTDAGWAAAQQLKSAQQDKPDKFHDSIPFCRSTGKCYRKLFN